MRRFTIPTHRGHRRAIALTAAAALVAMLTLGAAAPAGAEELVPTEPSTDVVEPAPEPAPEPVIEEPTAEPVVEPAPEPVEPPAAEPVAEPPADEAPVDEPTDEPADEPDDATQDSDVPAAAPALTADIGVLALTGAIFTTNSTCTGVNVNLFSAKTDVYLDGGPQGQSGSGLPDGFYYVKVTEPDGTLLGQSAAASIHVTNGSFDQCYNLFALTNFATTSNNGGEYKVWVSMDPSFPNNASKTDNFKVLSNPELLVPEVVTQVIDNGTGADITNTTVSIVEGETFTVHDVANVSGEGATPTGDVTFDFFSNGVCNPEDGGVLVPGSPVPLSGGTASSADSPNLPTGDPVILEYSYQASYSGDDDYLPGLADCEPFFVAIVASNITPIEPEVEGTSTGTAPAQLAFTGDESTRLAVAGLLLVLGGAALLTLFGRRDRRHRGLSL